MKSDRKPFEVGKAVHVETGGHAVIQASKLESQIMRYERAAIRPMLPNKPPGIPRVNDRRVLNGMFWVLRFGAPIRLWLRIGESTP